MVNKREPKFNAPAQAYDYAMGKNHKLGLDGEQLISTDVSYSYYYAQNVLKGRFKLGEKSIATNGRFSYCYAQNVLNSRFELGEQVIAKDGYYCCCYVHNVFKGLIPLDFLELCSIKVLEFILNVDRFEKVSKIINKNDIIRVLFKKKLLGHK